MKPIFPILLGLVLAIPVAAESGRGPGGAQGLQAGKGGARHAGGGRGGQFGARGSNSRQHLAAGRDGAIGRGGHSFSGRGGRHGSRGRGVGGISGGGRHGTSGRGRHDYSGRGSGWQASWREPGFSLRIGSGAGRSGYRRHCRPRRHHRDCRPGYRRCSWPGYGGGSYIHYGTRPRYRYAEPVPVVLQPPPPVPPAPTYKTVRTWIPPEKTQVWAPARTECGIRSRWMGDHWKFETDPDNCREVPGRMEDYVTREGYYKEEIVKLD